MVCPGKFLLDSTVDRRLWRTFGGARLLLCACVSVKCLSFVRYVTWERLVYLKSQVLCDEVFRKKFPHHLGFIAIHSVACP